MQVAVVPSAGADYEIEARDVPEPAAGEVRVHVHACGFCLSDENIRAGTTGADFPRVPGHEAAGTIDAVGDNVPSVWRRGDRVGVGWHGGHCLACDACREGDFLRCPQKLACGTSFDGGFAEALIAPWTALARIPDDVPFEEAGPVMCGGITVWNALRASGASWGDTVAVQGVGGLGHLAIQYADKMGFRTVAVSRGPGKEDDAHRLGADHYIDAAADDPGRALKALGGARAIITTAPSGAAAQPLLRGLGPHGRLVTVGVSGQPIAVSPADLMHNEKGLQGSVIGTPRDVERLLAFGALKGVRPWIERFPLEDIGQAAERLRAGDLRYRAVFEMAS